MNTYLNTLPSLLIDTGINLGILSVSNINHEKHGLFKFLILETLAFVKTVSQGYQSSLLHEASANHDIKYNTGFVDNITDATAFYYTSLTGEALLQTLLIGDYFSSLTSIPITLSVGSGLYYAQFDWQPLENFIKLYHPSFTNASSTADFTITDYVINFFDAVNNATITAIQEGNVNIEIMPNEPVLSLEPIL